MFSFRRKTPHIHDSKTGFSLEEEFKGSSYQNVKYNLFFYLLLCQSEQLLLGFLHLLHRPSDGNLVHAGALVGEVDVHAATLLHDGAHQTALWPDEGNMQL